MNERHRKKRLSAIRYVLALPRSVWYNFRLLPFRQARHLPLLISHRTQIVNVSGKVSLHTHGLRVGLVKIGFNTCQMSDFRYHRTMLNMRGRLDLMGECAIGAGSSIEVSESGTLILGDHFNMGPCSLIICNRNITFGNDVLTSWHCTFMDTDQHQLVDNEGRCCNEDRPILFGDNVWCGCHVIVTKGTHVCSHVTIGAGSCVHGVFDEEYTVIAGNPARMVRHGVSRNVENRKN
jgi:acetyltransferase-like isoleucine patch superfamily enzyme